MTTRADIEAIRQHAVWGSIRELQAKVADATPHDSTDRETLARVSAVLSYAIAYRSFGPHLFPSSWGSSFQNMQMYVNYVRSIFDDWQQTSSMNSSSVSNIDSYLDSILGVLVAFPSLQKESRAKVIAEAGDSYRVAAEASLTGLRAAISSLEAELEDQKATLNATLAEAEAAKVSAASAEKELAGLLEDADKVAKDSLAERMEVFDRQAQTAQVDLMEQSDALIVALKQREAKARELLEHVADASVAGGYQKYANRELKAFRLWNIAGLGVAGIVAIYLAFRFWDITELTVQESILRAAISLPGLAVAAYCLRQAGLRQKESIEAKYRELDLLALPPFTDSMDKAQKSELRMLLGTRIFAKSVQQAAESKGDASPFAGVSADDLAKLIQAFRTP